LGAAAGHADEQRRSRRLRRHASHAKAMKTASPRE
jgi:hypothetical protein